MNGPGIITNSGAVKGFAIDFCDRLGLDIPRLGEETLEALKAALPAFASLDNPVDVTAQVLRDLTIWTRTAQALLADPAIGSLCVPMVAGSPKLAMDKVHALLPTILQGGKPTVIAALGDDVPIPPEFTAAFRAQGIPVLRSPERALRALAHATAYGRTLAATGGAAMTISAPPLPGAERCPSIRARPIWRRSASRCRKARSRATLPPRRRSQPASAIRWRSRRRPPRSRTRATRAASSCASPMRRHSKPHGCASRRASRPRSRASCSTACWSRRWDGQAWR